MYLLGLLIVPLLIGLVATALGKGRLTWKELLVMEGVLIALLSAAYGIAYATARWSAVGDVEIWNGRIAEKDRGSEHCCHSYPCNCHPCNCDGEGDCSTCCDTCYLHTHDIWWSAEATTGDTVYHNGCNAPGTPTPKRWEAIRVGEPAAIEHSYENYILASPDTILRRHGMAERFRGLPTYPRPYDFYRMHPVVVAGAKVPPADRKLLDLQLAEINAKLGAKRQVNVLLVLTGERDVAWAEALNEHWVGGKKNDVLVVVGMPDYPAMAWVQVLSWTQREDMKVAIREEIMGLPRFEVDPVLAVLEREVGTKFVRRPMEDFAYLLDSIEPPWWAMILIFVIGIAAAVMLARYFIENDPFGDEWSRRTYSMRRRAR